MVSYQTVKKEQPMIDMVMPVLMVWAECRTLRLLISQIFLKIFLVLGEWVADHGVKMHHAEVQIYRMQLPLNLKKPFLALTKKLKLPGMKPVQPAVEMGLRLVKARFHARIVGEEVKFGRLGKHF